MASARDAVGQFERQAALRAARAQSLDETIARFQTEHGEAEAALIAVRSEQVGTEGAADLLPQLAAARQTAAAARETASAARTALDVETRERAGRQRRL